MVPDNEWERYIEISERDKILCVKCYVWIKGVIDKGVVQ